MKIIFDSRFKVNVCLIEQGEFYVSSEREILSTTLGSCISVCLFDERAKVGGLNHYMLPEPILNSDDRYFSKAKYGTNSMELLVNGLLHLGARRERLVAKIFGGANMFTPSEDNKSLLSIGEQNIAFAKRYLLTENIPVRSHDTGHNHARKIYFDSQNGFVKLFRLDSKSRLTILESEKLYHKKIRATDTTTTIQDKDKITFF